MTDWWSVLGIESWDLHLLGKYFPTEPHPGGLRALDLGCGLSISILKHPWMALMCRHSSEQLLTAGPADGTLTGLQGLYSHLLVTFCQAQVGKIGARGLIEKQPAGPPCHSLSWHLIQISSVYGAEDIETIRHWFWNWGNRCVNEALGLLGWRCPWGMVEARFSLQRKGRQRVLDESWKMGIIWKVWLRLRS